RGIGLGVVVDADLADLLRPARLRARGRGVEAQGQRQKQARAASREHPAFILLQLKGAAYAPPRGAAGASGAGPGGPARRVRQSTSASIPASVTGMACMKW